MADETTTDTRAVEVLAKHTADVSSYDSGDLHGCEGCDWTPPLGVGGVEWPAFYVHQADMLTEARLLAPIDVEALAAEIGRHGPSDADSVPGGMDCRCGLGTGVWEHIEDADRHVAESVKASLTDKEV